MMFRKIKATAICFFGFAITSAYAGSIELTNCEPGSLAYTYTVTGDTAEIFINSATVEDTDLQPLVVTRGDGQMEHDFADILPDNNNYVTLVDGTSISTALCQALTDDGKPTTE